MVSIGIPIFTEFWDSQKYKKRKFSSITNLTNHNITYSNLTKACKIVFYIYKLLLIRLKHVFSVISPDIMTTSLVRNFEWPDGYLYFKPI